MKLSSIETRWINLDKAVQNRIAMEKQFNSLGYDKARRISARVIAPPEGSNPAFGPHFVGCGQSHIDALESSASVPLLVLEDDAKVTRQYKDSIEIPAGADAIYLGWSRANTAMKVLDYNRDFVRIKGSLTTHAILYITERYKQKAIEVTKQAIYEHQMPLDIAFANMQADFNVYAVRRPFFVQSDERQSLNKWEAITSGVLLANSL